MIDFVVLHFIFGLVSAFLLYPDARDRNYGNAGYFGLWFFLIVLLWPYALFYYLFKKFFQ